MFTLADINQVCHLFDKFGKLIKFNDLVDKTGLSPFLFFKCMQLIDALPVNSKQAIKSNSNSMQSDSVSFSFSKYSLYSEKDSRIPVACHLRTKEKVMGLISSLEEPRRIAYRGMRTPCQHSQ